MSLCVTRKKKSEKKKRIELVFLAVFSISAAFVSYGSLNFQSVGYIPKKRGSKNPMPENDNGDCMFYIWGRTYEKTSQELPFILGGWHGYLHFEQLPQQPCENAIAFGEV